MKSSKFLRLLVFFLITLVWSCNENKQLTENEVSKIQKEVKSAMYKYFEHEKSLNPEKMMEIYWNDSSFVFGQDGYLRTDYLGLKNDFTEWTNSAKQWLDSNISKEYIYVLSRDAAVYSIQFDWNVLMQNGDTLKCKPGSYTFVLKKINNEWKSVHCNGTHVFIE